MRGRVQNSREDSRSGLQVCVEMVEGVWREAQTPTLNVPALAARNAKQVKLRRTLEIMWELMHVDERDSGRLSMARNEKVSLARCHVLIQPLRL